MTDWVVQFLQVLHQNTGNGTYIYIKVKTQFHKIGTYPCLARPSPYKPSFIFFRIPDGLHSYLFISP